MHLDDCYYLGYIVKPHGLKGDFQIKLDVSEPLEYIELESVFVEIDKQLVPFFIDQIEILPKNLARVHFEDIESTDQARQLVGKQLFLPLDILPKLDGNHFYYHEVEGYQVVDKDFGEIGPITKIQEAPAQDLMAIDCKGKEVLIPILDDTIVKLDREKNTFHIQTPTGLIDMYLEG